MIRVNGRSVALDDPGESLVEFLRRKGDKSCKVGCGSGSCGACSVLVTAGQGVGSGTVKSLNACLAPVATLAGCEVVTSKGLGNSKAGFHPIQERVGAFHASQCGFCTPGMVVACHAAKEKARAGGKQSTANGVHDTHHSGSNGDSSRGSEGDLQAMEHGLDGNLCRCTGYRPLLDVAKSFVPGVDIEDLGLHSPLDSAEPGSVTSAAATCNNGSSQALSVGEVEGSGKLWLFPESISELTGHLSRDSLTGHGLPPLVAGNTGSGLHSELWPLAPVVISVQRVREMRGVERQQDTLLVGAAVTIAELADALSSKVHIAANTGSSASSGTAALGSESPFAAMAAVLRRVAGTHVRNAATIGGNLVLARCHGLESDVATLLSGWGATVHLISGAGACSGEAAAGSATPVLDFVTATGSLEPGVVITRVTLPLPTGADFFWCHKVAPTYSNTHSIINAAFKLTLASSQPSSSAAPSSEAGEATALPLVSSATLVFGYPGPSGWVCQRATGAEKALTGCQLSLESLVAALQAVVMDLSPAPDMQQYCRGTAQGLLLQALAPLLRRAERDLPPAVARLLQVPQAAPPAPVKGSQRFEAASEGSAPVGLPIEKDRVRLQASGEAVFSADIPMPSDGLHAAFVTSTQARAAIAGIDPSAALELLGVVAFISAKDLPKQRNLISYTMLRAPDEPIFADERVEYYGQPLGLIVATSQGEATAAAQAVQVQYADIQPPIVTIPEAVKAGRLVASPFSTGAKSVGDAQGALSLAELSLQGMELEIPSQYHFYMEPQVTLCVPDEGGSMKVYSSTQCAEVVQEAVARALGLRLHDVNSICRRVGGGFGGKVSRSIPVATACAVAADTLGRPVKLVLDRPSDMALVGGRQPLKASYSVGFTREGVIQGLDIKCWLMTGAYTDSSFDAFSVKEGLEMCYAIPNMRVEVQICRGTLPPFTAMRGPGKTQATLLMEHVLDSVAAACGLDSTLVRERNLAKLPEGPQEDGIEGMVQFTFADPMFNKPIPAVDYTLPQLWRRLKESCDYNSRLKEVEDFNASSPWVKRGITITHSRFDTFIPSKPAAVSIFGDGSVLVYAGGAEIGQGLTTKVKQVAIMELSKVLPPSSGHIPLDLVRMGDNTTYVLPRGYMTAASTTSEAACAGVRKACLELVTKLKPFAEKLGEEATWEAVVLAASTAGGAFDSCKVLLVACSTFDKAELAAGSPKYVLFGAACTEAEVNVLTGERQVLRSDLMIDCGKSMNPAIDIGQAEGAFVQGLGCFLSEEVVYDPDSGRVLTASPWHYPIPTASSIPRVFNVELLPGVRYDRGLLSSKAIGEPPTLLAASAFFAIQAAVRAAREELQLAQPGAALRADSLDSLPDMSPTSVVDINESRAAAGAGGHRLAQGLVQVPANVKHVKEALGPVDIAAHLKRKAQKGS